MRVLRKGVISMIKFNVIKGHVLILNHALSITSLAPLVSIFILFYVLKSFSLYKRFN